MRALLAALSAVWLACPASAVPPPRRILVVGDSHLDGTFGRQLVAGLDALSPRRYVDVYASCGANPASFLTRPRTSQCGTWFRHGAPRQVESEDSAPTPPVSAALRPETDIVVIVLGTNMADWSHGVVNDLGDAGRLAAAATARGARCFWVGPPPARGNKVRGAYLLTPAQALANYRGLDAGLQAQVSGRCGYIASRLPYSGTDGMHYDDAASARWAGSVLAAIRSSLGVQDMLDRMRRFQWTP
jgi:hypothetical protein